jgi:hypothetical protein
MKSLCKLVTKWNLLDINMTTHWKPQGFLIPGRLYKVNVHCSCAAQHYSLTYFRLVLRQHAFVTVNVDGGKPSNSHPSPPTLKKESLVCTEYSRLGWRHSRSGRGWERESLWPWWESNPNYPVAQYVVQSMSLLTGSPTCWMSVVCAKCNRDC